MRNKGKQMSSLEYTKNILILGKSVGVIGITNIHTYLSYFAEYGIFPNVDIGAKYEGLTIEEFLIYYDKSPLNSKLDCIFKP